MSQTDMPARVDYRGRSLMENDLPEEPISLFTDWLQAAVDEGVKEANAFCLCTVSEDGVPYGRYLLLKGVESDGFHFFTNYGSDKAAHLDFAGKASMVFWWGALSRQIRITGVVTRLAESESDTYFHSRPRESQLAAWASRQSSLVENRAQMESRLEQMRQRFEGVSVPRPDFWGGYLLVPQRIEFWQGRSNRFHDRLVYSREEAGWSIVRLMP